MSSTKQPLTDSQVFSILDALQIRAANFIRQHDGAHLDREQLILRTMGHIQLFADVSDATAERCVVRALAEHESRNTRCYIDVDETTAYAVAVRDPWTKALRIFTVADLMRMVATPRLSAMPTPSKRAACAGHFL